MDSMNTFYAHQTTRQEAQNISTSNLQTPPLTLRSSTPSSFVTRRTTRYNNDDYSQVLEFKIQLKHIRIPAVWRRIQVPYDYTFFHFHLAIQCCMGWLNCHMHIFRTQEGFEYGNPHIDINYLDFPEVREEKTSLLKDYFHSKGQIMEYEYDLGDSWEHIITYEGVFDRKQSTQYPKCLRGRGKCPPEDIGGYDGFERFKEIIKDKNHPEYEEFSNWYGESDDYDPNEFHKDSAFNNLELMPDFRDVSDYC
ncbi:11569_t:CDS:2 [Funneliformis geosporum]|uniref:14250_t:CDS:1 n=1 Tax=Funneliformis geosporum TaxID=1117311 RepID=A0A9W4SJX7_9GLOM|nr:11569_t:CDS:2 [Funneliformis geosporum]CAI2171828.1 14250_t:CDS:2 [Funneliformis geosporum]